MTKDEISKIKEHIEIHSRREPRAIKITEIMWKAVDELECIAELEKELEQAKKVQVVEHFEAYGQCRDSRKIASLEKENAELKDKLKNLESVAEVRLANWQKYEEENKELKEQIEKMRNFENCDYQLHIVDCPIFKSGGHISCNKCPHWILQEIKEK